MQKLIKLSLLAIIILFLGISCTKSEGDWDDNIKLSQKKVEVSAGENSLLITTEENGWWIDQIEFDKTPIDFSEINTIDNDFVIEKENFKIERKNASEIHIDINANTTDSIRILKIGLQNGNYFDNIKITQLAK